MSSEQSPDWLPAGWTSRSKSNDYGKKVKFYVDPETGHKFYSKAQVLRQLEKAKSDVVPELAICSVDNAVNKANESPINKANESNKSPVNKANEFPVNKANESPINKANESNESPVNKANEFPVNKANESPVNKADESLDWLPDGWIMEERTHNSGKKVGSKFKVYSDPKSGHKFYSKPEVFRYLAKTSSSSSPPLGIHADTVSSSIVEMKRTNEETKQASEETKQTIEEMKQTNESPEWLPQGWSVESKTGEKGKKRKVYIDPASGFKFYSKPQVSRYLEKINPSPQIVTDSNPSPLIVTGSNPSPQIVTGSNPSPLIVTGSNPSQQIVTSSANDLCLDQSTESGLSLKPYVSPTHQINKSKFDEKKLNGGDDLIENGTFEKVTDEKFPPGWVKEIRTRKTGGKHKDQFYIDPVSGYMFRSKVDALRFLETGDIKMCKCRATKRDISDLNLMNNNTPNNIGPSIGGRNFSKPEASEDHKTNQSNISGDPSVVKASRSNGAVGKNASEEIPPGWKIEFRTRKMANRIVKDPYYLDPVTGYEFRSKPDVLRYLETGDINSCKIKPKKRDVNALMSDENISPSPAAEAMKAGTTMKQQFPDDTIVSKSAVSPKVGRSQSRRRSVSVATMDLSSPAVHILEASPGKISEPINEDSKGEESLNFTSANDIILSVINDIFNDDEVLGSDEHIIEETRSSTKSKKKRVLNPPLRSSKRLAGVNLHKTEKSSLGESSQAVAGNGDEIKVNSLSHISASPCKAPQQLQTPTEGEVVDPTSIWKDNILNSELNGNGKKLVDKTVAENHLGKQVTEKPGNRSPQKELAQNAFTGDEITSTVYRKDDKGKGEQGVALENHLGRQEAEKQNDGRHESEQPPIEYPYMEDPCFEFAFKTLTGAIPVEENLSFQDYFKQQADTSQNEYIGEVQQPSEIPPGFSKVNEYNGQVQKPLEIPPGFSKVNEYNAQVQNPSEIPPGFSKVEVASLSAATETPVPLQQLPPNSTYPVSENISVPSFTSSSQQYGFGAGWQTKAK